MNDHLQSRYIQEERINIDSIPAILFRPKEGKACLQSSFTMVGVQGRKTKA